MLQHKGIRRQSSY